MKKNKLVSTVKKNKKIVSGNGLLDSVINKLPFEIHLPGHQYCGPGTKLAKRLARGDPGISLLDSACKDHDIVYEKYKTGKERNDADKVLASKAWKRIKSKDASLGERAAALAVVGGMKAKMGLSKVGGGLKRLSKKNIKKSKEKVYKFNDIVKGARLAIRTNKPQSIQEAVNFALKAAKDVKNGRKGSTPRIIPIPKSGGALPLIPIFAGLSAIGSLIGGSAAVVRAVSAGNEARKQLLENERHNQVMEAVAINKTPTKGDGLYLKKYRKGLGLYLDPKNL